MAGLSIVLESQDATKTITTSASNKKSAQVINKVITIVINKPTPPPSPSSTPFKSPFPRCTFLDKCFLCKHTLLPTEDIYMYKGNKAFCSVECRCKQIFMDEEDQPKMKMMSTKTETPNNNSRDKCALAAARRPPVTSSPCLRKTRYY
ncbi:FLZ-type domain-containing protein [Heracleum sosnowskyi]|uniref:FLZ-type domain-containing protein n=1 Tax=Heracleum sosnowskyi TaxID=360622 RepID=A0AAD8IMQ9_9APIA|nr:FLZ-type domain-containing protein [Heracleum sosnowskyi]